jgi:hypothetical protein
MTGSFVMKVVSSIVITLALLAAASSSASAALDAKAFFDAQSRQSGGSSGSGA